MKSAIRTEGTGTKNVFYAQICEQLDRLISSESSFIANAANTAALLFQLLPDVNWVGFYLLEGNELVLGPFQGKPVSARILLGKGACGTAALEERTLVVAHVDQFAGHIVRDPASQSEIVVPLLNWGKLIGVLDVDSASVNRFDEDDREGLESIVAVLLAAGQDGEPPDFSDDAAEG